MEVIIAWLKRKHPIGGCAVHPDEHCFFNKLGHWILDPYKLLIWAIEIVSPFLRIPHWYLKLNPQHCRNAARRLEHVPQS